ncbi:MAG: adenosylcobalamin-dependent ribonucleoside-diphosphate reductase [Deltaproteobacteria bacterium]|nr:adenosylcobalamin-dependent ribonucleoside-diphosphate reductase [Deltaproteobacteria bacterium]
MKIPRLISSQDPFSDFEYKTIDVRITDKHGNVKLFIENCEVPAHWSINASEILVYNYFRKKDVPSFTVKIPEKELPLWLCPSKPDDKKLAELPENKRFGPEKSIKQVAHRLAGTWTYWGFKLGYFDTEEDAYNFYCEIVHCFIGQYAAPNSPQLINTGLWWAYGINKKDTGFYIWKEESKSIEESPCSYKHPCVSACFILEINDSLTRAGGIYDTLQTEARIFKYGAGAGLNYSSLRSKKEKIDSGFESSGALEFIKLSDFSAGTIKSGGIDRGSSKMAVLNVEHPDIEEFILWKARTEFSKHMSELGKRLIQNNSGELFFSDNRRSDESSFSVQVQDLADTVQKSPGGNTNVSVAIPNSFMQAVEEDRDWDLLDRSGKKVQSISARRIWDLLCFSAWFCGDPGVQFTDTINLWHTCKESGKIDASNPCSEYYFLGNTACNLASLNVKKFFCGSNFLVEQFIHVSRLWALVLDISISFAQYPNREIAMRSHEFRTIGLGITNLGSLILSLAIPYDSQEARFLSCAILAILTLNSYRVSYELACSLGAFPKFDLNKKSMLDVIQRHCVETEKLVKDISNSNSLNCVANFECLREILLKLATDARSWDKFRNAQVTAIAPTGTISFILDCETTGIEPEFSYVKIKKLRGGSQMRLLNYAITEALEKLGYTRESCSEIEKYVTGHKTLVGAPCINHSTLLDRGFSPEDLNIVENLIMTKLSLREVFSPNNFSPSLLERLSSKLNRNVGKEACLLTFMGFNHDEIEQAEKFCFGNNSIVGAPNLRKEHFEIFRVANSLYSEERIPVEGHIKMIAEAQKFVSGGISKTVNLPQSASIEDVSRAFYLAWKLGAKSLTVYRDGSKIGQPLVSLKHDRQLEALSPHTPERRVLPARRSGFTQKVLIGGQKVYLRTGEYEDGKLGEIFIDLSKEGAALRSIMNHFAIAVSIGLQYGVPLEEYVDAFLYTKYEPSGPVVGSEHIKTATSISDYIFKELAVYYLNRKDLIQSSSPTENRQKKTEIKHSSLNLGFEGEPCPKCGNFTLIRSGLCVRCVTCGYSTGCS